MNDPHVVDLTYHLRTGPDVSYKPGTTTTWKTPEFDGDLTAGVLTLKMTNHHATVGSAQGTVQPYLRAWEIQTGLQHGLGYLEFEYKTANVVDRNPPPPGARVLHAEASSYAVFAMEVTGHLTNAKYPSPPSSFAVSPIVTTLWQRFRNFIEGKEPLTGMGYFCLSVLQADAGGRRHAATKFTVHIDVLDTLGRLTSEVGDESTARKLDQGTTFRPHTNAETDWIKAAVKRLILRAGEIAANSAGSHSLIEMSNLPTI